MAHFVYILECADKTLYVGYTTDIVRRLKEHNGAKVGARYTKMRRPVKLKYEERFKTVNEALRREAEIKSWKRPKKLALFK